MLGESILPPLVRFLQKNFSAKGLKRTHSSVRLASADCSQGQVESVCLLHWPFPGSSVQMSQEEAVKKTWCVESRTQFQSLRKGAPGRAGEGQAHTPGKGVSWH